MHEEIPNRKRISLWALRRRITAPNNFIAESEITPISGDLVRLQEQESRAERASVERKILDTAPGANPRFLDDLEKASK